MLRAAAPIPRFSDASYSFHFAHTITFHLTQWSHLIVLHVILLLLEQ